MAAIERVGLARRTIPHQTSTSIVPQLISRLHRPACKLYASAAVQHAQLTLERPLCTSHVAEQNSIVPAPALVTKRLDEVRMKTWPAQTSGFEYLATRRVYAAGSCRAADSALVCKSLR